MASDSFDAFFHVAAGHPPYNYQRRLATDSPPGSGGGQGVVVERVGCHMIHIRTGAGKTAAAILAWLWRLKVDRDNTPRRLIYCLPMRACVRQTSQTERRSVEEPRRGGGLVTQIGGSAGRDRGNRTSMQRGAAVWAT
jgi:CRISPR-associated endonuclease/helicase Cas3